MNSRLIPLAALATAVFVLSGCAGVDRRQDRRDDRQDRREDRRDFISGQGLPGVDGLPRNTTVHAA